MLAPNANKNLYLAWCEAVADAEKTMKEIDQRTGPVNAEVVPGIDAFWYALMIAPQHENIAAAHLAARRFGIYLPEFEVTEVRRGRKVDRTKLLLPGYLFVHVWDIDRHTNRIRSCPGVLDFLKFGEQIVQLPWSVINAIRVIENHERPIALPMDEVVVPAKKKKKRWRKSRLTQTETVQIPNEILCVHAYSPMIEELRRAGLDDQERLDAFHRALASLGS